MRIKKGKWLDIFSAYRVYDEEVAMVADVLEKSNVDLKEVFFKYIDIEPEYFESFVPSKYLKSNKFK